MCKARLNSKQSGAVLVLSLHDSDIASRRSEDTAQALACLKIRNPTRKLQGLLSSWPQILPADRQATSRPPRPTTHPLPHALRARPPLHRPFEGPCAVRVPSCWQPASGRAVTHLQLRLCSEDLMTISADSINTHQGYVEGVKADVISRIKAA
jgi:hypothetical protein